MDSREVRLEAIRPVGQWVADVMEGSIWPGMGFSVMGVFAFAEAFTRLAEGG